MSDDLLLPFARDGKWGYLHAHGAAEGAVAIPPQFSTACLFREGLALVNVGGADEQDSDEVEGRWGFIDATGRFRIEPVYDQASDVSEGLACVNVGARKGYAPYDSFYFVTGGRWGFIDESGWRIPATFDSATPFSEGLASVRERELTGYIDRESRLIIPHSFSSGGPFREGRAAVSVGQGKSQRCGYIDREGKLVAEPRWRIANSFSEGLGQVLDGATFRYFYVGLGGDVVVTVRDSVGVAMPFSEGLALASFAEIKPYNDGSGFYPMRGVYGFLDRTGTFAIAPRFEYATDFKDGLAAATEGGGWGYIDRAGAFVVPPRFESAHAPVGGMGRVYAGRDASYVDLRKYIAPFERKRA